MSKKRNMIGIGLAICVVGIILWQAWPFRRQTAGAKPNLIIISLDTLRADRLGLYGYERQTSPFLDKLAAKGAVFENATSATCWTLPAHVSMFSGLYPTTHGVTDVVKIQKETPLIAEMLRAKGYRTFGFPGGGYVSAAYGFDRGFDYYPGTKPKRRLGPEGGLGVTISRAKEVLEKLEPSQPFFLFMHTMDIHCPYDPPEPYYSMFKSDGAQTIKTKQCIGHKRSGKLPKEKVLFLSDRYDGGIRWADDNLANFFAWLEDKGRLSNTYVMILSDHGEEFVEHGYIGHKHSLHREVISVPFIVLGPDIRPARHEVLANVVDVTPTALDLLGLPVPAYMQGFSLASILRGGGNPDSIPAWRFAELGRGKELRSNFADTHHLILDMEKDDPKFYDLVKDPQEQENIARTESARAAAHTQELTAFMSELDKPTSEMEAPELDDETIQQLKTLGYL